MAITDASLEQLRTAAIKTCKINIRAIDLLALVTIHYHPNTAQQQGRTLRNTAQRNLSTAEPGGSGLRFSVARDSRSER